MHIQPIERDEKHAKAYFKFSKRIVTIQNQIQTVRRRFKAFECKFQQLKGILTIQVPIRTNQTRLEAFECIFEPFERDSNHLNANSRHSKGIQRIQMQIQTIP